MRVFASAAQAGSEWSSLEVVKILVAVLAPLLAGLVIGLFLRAVGTRVENAQWTSRKLIERRLDVYDEMAPKVNELYCFFMLKGDFRDTTPDDAIDLKRDLDKLFHTNRFLFGDEVRTAYASFMDAMFDVNIGVNSVAQPRSSALVQQAERGEAWKPEWAKQFAPPNRASSRAEIQAVNDALLESFAREIEVIGAPGAKTG